VIQKPRRAVTRFFVPFIDVLILLFGIFLLMPFVSGPTTPEPQDAKPAPPEPPPGSAADLARQLKEAQDRIARMEKAAQARVTDRLMVRVLHIDGRDGTLYYFDPDRREVRTAAQARNLIDQQKDAARKAGGVKDIFFLILYPQKSGFPTAPQEDQIHAWFKDVPHEFK
jgi:hypothetical protein